MLTRKWSWYARLGRYRRRMDRVRQLVVDWWLPVGLLALVWAEAGAGRGDFGASSSAVLAAMIPLVLVVGRRRHEPVFVAIAASVLATVFVLGGQDDPMVQPPLAAFLALLVSTFSLGLRGRSWPGALVVAGVLVVMQIMSALAGQRPDDYGPSSLFLAGAYVVGRLIQRSRDDAETERRRAQVVEAERERHIKEATIAERARIARELHDVIAHSLSLIVVQSSVEARVAGTNDGSAATLRSVEQQGRTALVELRRLLGFLREDEAALAPLPRLADLDALVAQLRAAGHSVSSATAGEARDLPPGVELAAYRVLQEAVTNVAKHAPGSDVRFELGYLPAEIRVTITNGPAKSSRTLDLEPGAGIAGMRERVRIYGGLLTAEPTAGGGFEVIASIPEGAA